MEHFLKAFVSVVLCFCVIAALSACSDQTSSLDEEKENKNDRDEGSVSTTALPSTSTQATIPQIVGTEGLSFMAVPDGSSYVVTGIGTATDTDIVIPSLYNEKPVSQIASSAFAENETLTSVVIPGSVKIIGEKAFVNCTNIASITLCDGVEILDEGCFFNCKSLLSIEIPESVTTIEASAFYSCSALEELFIPGNVTRIESKSFGACRSLIKVEIADGLLSIGAKAFEDCGKLTELILPSTLETVGKGILCGNRVLQTLTTPFTGENSADKDGLGYFFGEKSPSSSDVPSSLKTVYLNGSGALGDKWLSRCSKVETIIIGSGYTSIGEYAFSGCSALKNVTFEGTSVTELGRNCFANCKALESIVIPEGVLTIGTMAFTDCVALKTVSLPNSLEEIGHQAFIRCKKMEELVIPENVKLIGSFFVADNNALTNLVFADPTGWVIAENKEGNNSEARDVSDPAANASYFSRGGRNYYVIKMN